MSLEKKVKDTRNALSTDHHLPQCCEKNLILLIDTHLEELGKVAQKIRGKIEIAKRKEDEAHDRLDSEWEDIWNGYREAMEEVLGLLVEDSKEGEK